MGGNVSKWVTALFIILVFSAAIIYLFTAFTLEEEAPTTTTLIPLYESTTLLDPGNVEKSSAVIVAEIERVNEIVDKRNSSECDSIDSNALPYARDMCHYTIAVNSRNESLCSGVGNDNLRATCVDRIRIFISVEANFSLEGEILDEST